MQKPPGQNQVGAFRTEKEATRATNSGVRHWAGRQRPDHKELGKTMEKILAFIVGEMRPRRLKQESETNSDRKGLVSCWMRSRGWETLANSQGKRGWRLG